MGHPKGLLHMNTNPHRDPDKIDPALAETVADFELENHLDNDGFGGGLGTN